MRLLKIMLIILVMGVLVVPLLSCGSESDEAELSEDQIATVQRGDITVDITAAGNLALSRTEDLAFEIAGTVAEVLVEEGDIVEEGQLLAKLDTSEWEDELSTLEDRVTTAERNVTAKERALTATERKVTTLERQVITKETSVTKADRQVAAKEFAVRQAQLDLQTAEYNLSQIAEVKEAQDTVDNAEYALKFAKSVMSGEFGGGWQISNYMYWSQLAALAKAELTEAQRDLQDILDGSSIKVSSDVALEVAKSQLQVEQRQMQLEDAQITVEDAKSAVADANLAVEDANLAVEDAQKDVEDAEIALEDAQKDAEDTREALNEALNKSLQVTAPFAGFITRVNVEGGDEVLKGTIAVQLADPNKFEADIMVSEMDILQVKLGGEAWVQVDAMPGMSLPAKVTHIAPTATIQQGVVNYGVKVEVQSQEALMRERQEARQEAMVDIASGELPERLQQAIEEGRITREQVEEMIKQRQAAMGSQAEPGQVQQAPSMIPEDFQLREGLTVTVSIIVEEKTDVLLVPNAAITSQRGQSYVQVVSPSGETEQRAIQTGISDWQFTEVTEGLSEGEQILVPQGTTTTPTTEPGPRGPMPFFGPPH